jgi:hypothetical protein
VAVPDPRVPETHPVCYHGAMSSKRRPTAPRRRGGALPFLLHVLLYREEDAWIVTVRSTPLLVGRGAVAAALALSGGERRPRRAG